MLKASFLIAILIWPLVNFAQIHLGVQSGIYKAAGYQNIKAGNNICFEVSNILPTNLIVTTHVNYGNGQYYHPDNIFEPEQVEKDKTNSNINTIHVGLMAGYHYPVTNWFNVSAQIGISSYTETTEYPYHYEGGSSYLNSTFTDIAFPIKVSLALKPFNDFEIAIVGGCYFEPDYPLLGFHVGPQINLSF